MMSQRFLRLSRGDDRLLRSNHGDDCNQTSSSRRTRRTVKSSSTKTTKNSEKKKEEVFVGEDKDLVDSAITAALNNWNPYHNNQNDDETKTSLAVPAAAPATPESKDSKKKKKKKKTKKSKQCCIKDLGVVIIPDCNDFYDNDEDCEFGWGVDGLRDIPYEIHCKPQNHVDDDTVTEKTMYMDDSWGSDILDVEDSRHVISKKGTKKSKKTRTKEKKSREKKPKSVKRLKEPDSAKSVRKKKATE